MPKTAKENEIKLISPVLLIIYSSIYLVPNSFATTHWLIFCYWCSRAKSSKIHVAYELVRLFGLLYERKFSYYCVNEYKLL